jgi:hypothetical protein
MNKEVVRVCKTKTTAWNARRDHLVIIARRLGLDGAMDGCYDSRKVGEYTTTTIFLIRTMEYLSAFSIMCYLFIFYLFRRCRCSKVAQFASFASNCETLVFFRHITSATCLLSINPCH